MTAHTTRHRGPKKVFVGLSGGVDSSVSAALLQKAGYSVTGVFIKVWEPPFLPCTWREERRDAQRVAAHLGIPLLTLDASETYKREVVDRFIAAYARGETPNPDVLCNREIKFGVFHAFAKKEGADLIATGHYAEVRTEHGTSRLFESADREKDQTYFLWTMPQHVLRETVFPIGHLTKDNVRQIAKNERLPTATKKDSQGICFLGAVEMEDLLKEFLPRMDGDVHDENGRVVGRHHGAVFSTIGARHGFSITPESPDETPWFIVAKDVGKNTLTVAHKDPGTGKTSHATRAVSVRSWNIISGEPYTHVFEKGELSARVRYRQEFIRVSWKHVEPNRVELAVPCDGVAPGQSLVLYRNGECLGGGEIAAGDIG